MAAADFRRCLWFSIFKLDLPVRVALATSYMMRLLSCQSAEKTEDVFPGPEGVGAEVDKGAHKAFPSVRFRVGVYQVVS